jgi:hypothetical protein
MNRHKVILTEKDLYQMSNLDVDWKTYKEVIWAYNEFISTKMIEEGSEIVLPRRLGTLRVKRRKTNPNQKRIDFKKTRELGQTVYHTNKHSEGDYGIFIWNKRKPQAVFANKQIYKLQMTRTNKRNLSKAIKERNTISKYIKFD